MQRKLHTANAEKYSIKEYFNKMFYKLQVLDLIYNDIMIMLQNIDSAADSRWDRGGEGRATAFPGIF